MDHIPSAPVTSSDEIVQFFRLIYQEAIGIRLTVATHRKFVTQHMEIALYDAPPDEKDSDLGPHLMPEVTRRFRPIATLTKSVWSDNEAIVLHVDPKRLRKGSRYALHVTTIKTPGASDLFVWMDAAEGRLDGHISAYQGTRHQGNFGLFAEVLGCDPIVPSVVPSGILYSPVTQCNLNCIHCISVETRSSKNRLCTSIKEQISA